MSEFPIGDTIAGTFRLNEDVRDKEGCKLEKINGNLYLLDGGSKHLLEPLDEDSDNIVVQFSDETGDNVESIWRLNFSEGFVTVVLYTYSYVQRLESGNQKMAIHLTVGDESAVCGENGLNGIKAENKDEVPDVLSDFFLHRKSIFVREKKEPGNYEIVGREHRADLTVERPGVYVLSRIRRNMRKDAVFALSQIFGNIKFITYSQSLSEEDSPVDIDQLFKINDIFKAWDQYTDFKTQAFYEDLANCIISFNRFEERGDKLIFTLDNPLPSNLEGEEFSMYSQSTLPTCPIKPEGFKRLREEGQRPVYLGKIIEVNDTTISFAYPNDRYGDSQIQEMNSRYNGVLFRSDLSLEIEKRRRQRVLTHIMSKKNLTANIIMRLSSNDLNDSQHGSSFQPVNADTLKRMFGRPDFELKENYRNAMDIALNTPDIALIQGPPGTGKTTLIKGIVSRLNSMNKNYHILVSAEQHEALYNMAGRVSSGEPIPPFISSQRKDMGDEDAEQLETTIEKYQSKCEEVCNELLEELGQTNPRSQAYARMTAILNEIQNDQNKTLTAALKVDELRELAIELDCHDDIYGELCVLKNTKGSKKIKTDVDPDIQILRERLYAQRRILNSYLSDDGRNQFKLLYRAIERVDESNLPKSELVDDMLSDDEDRVRNSFGSYLSFIDGLRDIYIPDEFNEFDDPVPNIDRAIESIKSKMVRDTEIRTDNLYDIVESFAFLMSDQSSVAHVIRKYTPVIGSTCAQANKSTVFSESNGRPFDYVIVDEASRANPIDIMIPVMMGTRVLLVGDQNQLPHYIENEVVTRFNKDRGKYLGFDEGLLKKSLFQLIYDNLETAYKDGRLAFRRTAMIEEQHRMHPVIGDFISKEFYDGKIVNGAHTDENNNDFGIFDGLNVYYINIPILKGAEESCGTSYRRECEANIIMDSILEDLIGKNPGRELHIGIISFYRAQVDLINERLDRRVPHEIRRNISCNTVDSFQGKEFDIVIISGVRCNSSKRMDFLTPSRVNVALSRARRLLIFVGDVETYRRVEQFDHFFDYVNEVNKR